MTEKNVIVEKSIDFSVELIKFCELLDDNKKYIVSKQLLRSGTSIGANVFEAQHAESRADFIHKMKIAAKEASETFYWLLICEKVENYPANSSLKKQLEELIRILSSIIITSKSRFRTFLWNSLIAFSTFWTIKIKTGFTGIGI